MDNYREALHHLNDALDAMVRQGGSNIIANIAQPIAMVERVVLQRQIEVIQATAARGVAP